MVTVPMECEDCTDKCPYFEPNICIVKDNKFIYGTCEKTDLDGKVVDLMIFCPFIDNDNVNKCTFYLTGTDYPRQKLLTETTECEVKSKPEEESLNDNCCEDCKHYHQFFDGMVYCDKGEFILTNYIPYCPFHEKPRDKKGLDIKMDISSSFDNDKRYCQSCGAKNSTNHKYCCECGELLRPLHKNGELLKSFIKEEKENVCEECGNWDSVWDLCKKAHNPQVKYTSTDKLKAEHICFDCKDYQRKQENNERKELEKLIMIFLSVIIFILLMAH